MKKKYQPTPEQTAARDAKRERFKLLVKQVAEMPEADRAALAIKCGAVVTCEGRGLSPHNTLLCFLQNPGVSIVGGFRQWIAAGRCVKKGEHGLTIWIPLGGRSDAGDGASEAPSDGADEGSGQRFGTATVFDVSQTAELTAETAAESSPAACPPALQHSHNFEAA